jgi:hypothetical protein
VFSLDHIEELSIDIAALFVVHTIDYALEKGGRQSAKARIAAPVTSSNA